MLRLVTSQRERETGYTVGVWWVLIFLAWLCVVLTFRMMWTFCLLKTTRAGGSLPWNTARNNLLAFQMNNSFTIEGKKNKPRDFWPYQNLLKVLSLPLVKDERKWNKHWLHLASLFFTGVWTFLLSVYCKIEKGENILRIHLPLIKNRLWNFSSPKLTILSCQQRPYLSDDFKGIRKYLNHHDYISF